ncbi:porin family protein [bacterium]|nr:porin family protein [bacterium]
MKSLWMVLLLLALASTLAADELLPGTPGQVVIPPEDNSSTNSTSSANSGSSQILYGGRFGFFAPFSQNNYLGYSELAWRFEGLVYLEAGDFKAQAVLGFYTDAVRNSPDYVGEPTFMAIPISMGAYYQLGNRFSPYLGGGLGFTIFSMSDRRHSDDGFRSEFTELLFTPHIAAGVDLFRNEAFRLNAELRLELSWSEEQSQVGGFSLVFGMVF